MQLGGSFVFAPGDRELFAHVSSSFSDNAPLSELLGALPQRKRAGRRSPGRPAGREPGR